MSEIEYLNNVLAAQDLPDDEKAALVERRDAVARLVRDNLPGVSLTVRWAGSYAKETMVRESYDADVVVYVHSGEDGAGSTLDEIYATVEGILKKEHRTERKSSAIRLLAQGDASYEHVDVVPGRFFDGTRTDTWLHRTDGDKCRFKTNLDVHHSAIRDSGYRPLIRLVKLWARMNGIVCRTFILELLAIDLAAESGSASLADQVTYFFEQLRNDAETLSVEDPANPTGNDLSSDFDEAKPSLTYHAGRALASIGAGDWEAVFGPIGDEQDKAAALKSVAVHVKPTSEPWGRD